MNNRRIIVVGASAGGVDALRRIVPQLSANLPAPILLVLHIGAHPSQLPALLSQWGPNKAVFARPGVVPQPGTIYVAPPDQHLLLDAGVLRLARGPKEHHARPAINPLFRSAALELGPRVVGVVLTGMLDDGSAGLRAVKACGGIAVVQDPHDAAEPSMPRSALAAVAADHVINLEGMASLLNRLALPVAQEAPVKVPEWLRIEHAISLGGMKMQELAKIGVPSGYTCPDCGGALFQLNDDRPLRFLCHTGHAFSLRSLTWTHEQSTDVALWAGLRALQEQEALMRRLAEESEKESSGAGADSLADADKLAKYIEIMREVVGAAPPNAVDVKTGI